MDITKLKSIIEETCDVSLDDFNEDSRLADLGLDSLDVAQVIFSIESDMDITIDSDSLENMSTVGDALRAIQNAINS